VLKYEEKKAIYTTADQAWDARNNRLTLWNLPVACCLFNSMLVVRP
jgi:hypothetical protein